MVVELAIFILIGLGAGFLGGLLGIGGGLVVVPAFAFYLHWQGWESGAALQTAIATSLATVLVTAAASTWGHHRAGAIEWPRFRSMAVGLAAGAAVGAIAIHYAPDDLLRLVFGAFAIFMALHMALGGRVQSGSASPTTKRPPGNVTGAIIGAVSACLGIGGGTLSVPVLIRYGLPLKRAIATSAACGLPIAVAGTLSLVALELQGNHHIHWPAFAFVAAASLFAAPQGARLAHHLPVRPLRLIFSVYLLLVGLRMILAP